MINLRVRFIYMECFIVYYLLFLYYVTPKSISIDYKAFNYLVQVELTVGKEPVIFPINMLSPYTWINYPIKKKTNDAIIHGTSNIIVSGSKFDVSDITEVIELQGKKSMLRFYAGNINSYIVRDSGYAFPYRFDVNEFSIVYQLKKFGFIDYLAFSFIPFGKEGKMRFGTFPHRIREKYNMGMCKVNDMLSTWGCSLHDVIIGDLHFSNTYNMKFQSMGDSIAVPEEFFYALTHVFDSNSCQVKTSKKEMYYYCKAEYINNYKNEVKFVIGDYKYTFDMKDLFLCEEVNYCNSAFVFDQIHVKEWTFGYIFLSHYISSFDYEKGIIKFFSKDKIEKLYNDENIKDSDDCYDNDISYEFALIIKYIMAVIILILVVSLIYLLIVLKKTMIYN